MRNRRRIRTTRSILKATAPCGIMLAGKISASQYGRNETRSTMPYTDNTNATTLAANDFLSGYAGSAVNIRSAYSAVNIKTVINSIADRIPRYLSETSNVSKNMIKRFSRIDRAITTSNILLGVSSVFPILIME